MDQVQFLTLVDELLELKPGTLKGEERLADLEPWGSLAVIGFMSLAHEHFGTVLTAEQFSSAKTVNDLVRIAQPS